MDKEKIKQRLLSGICVSDTQCWEWQKALRAGYGTMSVHNKHINTHRLSYLVHIGDIPKGMDVCHSCDNRLCINPDHLFLGSRKENMQDASAKGRLGKAGGIQYVPRTTPPFNRLNTKKELLYVLSEIKKHPTESMASICRRVGFNYQSLIDYRKGKKSYRI